jgi:hypothetical protein
MVTLFILAVRIVSFVFCVPIFAAWFGFIAAVYCPIALVMLCFKKEKRENWVRFVFAPVFWFVKFCYCWTLKGTLNIAKDEGQAYKDYAAENRDGYDNYESKPGAGNNAYSVSKRTDLGGGREIKNRQGVTIGRADANGVIRNAGGDVIGRAVNGDYSKIVDARDPKSNRSDSEDFSNKSHR